MAIVRIDVPITIACGTVKSKASCTIEIDTVSGVVNRDVFQKLLSETFARHLREMADVIDQDGIAAVQGVEYDIDIDDLSG